MQQRDFYDVLGISRQAEAAEVKRAYRELAMRYHPDRNPDDSEAEDAFKEATMAYSVLSHPEKRARYDRMGHATYEKNSGGFDAADFSSVSEILEGLFGEVFGGGRRNKQNPRDLKYELKVSFVEAALGAERMITVERPGPCATCKGSGAKPGTPLKTCDLCHGRGQLKYQRGLFATSRACHNCKSKGQLFETACTICEGSGRATRPEQMKVKIPAGIKDKAVRTVRGAGELRENGTGDLHITIHVEDDPFFEREGADVRCQVPIPFPLAVLGGHIDVPTLEGKVSMKLPAGTQSGKVFRLRGKGIPVYGGYGKGDQFVTIMVEVPERITTRQRKLISELATELHPSNHPQHATFLTKLKGLFG